MDKIPKCYCGHHIRDTDIATRCNEYGNLLKNMPDFKKYFKEYYIGRASCCKKWGIIQAKSCGAELNIDECQKCWIKNTQKKEEDMPEEHKNNRNPFYPTECQGCGILYTHGDEKRRPECSHTTCICGYQQCKVCLMTFYKDGESVNTVHYSYIQRTVLSNGDVVQWYPERCPNEYNEYLSDNEMSEDEEYYD